MVVEPAVDDATEVAGAAPVEARGSYCKKYVALMRQHIHASITVRGYQTHLCQRGLAQEVHRRLEKVDEVILKLRERVLHVQGVEVLVQGLAARHVQELYLLNGQRSMKSGHFVKATERQDAPLEFDRACCVRSRPAPRPASQRGLVPPR